MLTGTVPLALASVLAESSKKSEGVPAWLIGVGVFALLAFLLFVTSQFNRDR